MRAGWWILGGVVVLAGFGGAAVTTPIIWSVPPFYRLKAQPYQATFDAAEKAYNLPAGLLMRVAYQESRFDASARSPVGALGLMQFMPATAAQFGVDPLNPYDSIYAAARYLSGLYRQFGNWSEALAAYNWGPGNVAKHGLDNAPAETVAYYSSITSDLGIA